MAEKRKPGRPPSASKRLAEKTKEKKEEWKIPTGAVHVCTHCGDYATKSSLEAKFYISYSIFHEKMKRVPICKECVRSMSTVGGELIPRNFVEVIRALDKPFINTIFESTVNEVINTHKDANPLGDPLVAFKKHAHTIIGLYIKNISMQQYREMTWLDGDQRLIPKNAEIINSLGEVEVSSNDLVYKWGEGYDESEFVYLENRYNTLTAMANVEYESDIMMLKQICLEELDLRNIRKKGGDTSKKLENIQKLMATANIRPTDIKNANSDLLNDSYGKWLNVIEEYEPAEYFADKPLFEDYDNIKKYVMDWVLRPLKNLLKGTRDFNVDENDVRHEE